MIYDYVIKMANTRHGTFYMAAAYDQKGNRRGQSPVCGSRELAIENAKKDAEANDGHHH